MKYINTYNKFNESLTDEMIVDDIQYKNGLITYIELNDGRVIDVKNDDLEFGSYGLDINGCTLKKGDIISFQYDIKEITDLYDIRNIIVNNKKYEASINPNDTSYLSINYTYKICKPYINWNMIEDAKEISLEYLDEGYTLYINIVNIATNQKIYGIMYNHDVSIGRWKITNKITNRNIHYYDNDKFIGYFFSIQKNEKSNFQYLNEFSNQLIDMYPNYWIDNINNNNIDFSFIKKKIR